MAENGDTLAIMGTGVYNPGGRVTGGGTFVHTDPSGGVVHYGTWTAAAVLSYEDFGNGIVDGFPRSFHGGVLVLAVTASDNFGTTVSAVLTVTCVLGEDVPAGAEEGITALIPGGVSFDESVSGNTLFVLTP